MEPADADPLEEHEGGDDKSKDDPSKDDGLNLESMGQTLHALQLFCTAKPSLVVNHIDTIAHFLKHEQALKAVRHVCEMLPMLLRILDHPKKSLLMTLETYLAALVFRVQETLLQAAIPALCMTIKSSGNKVYSSTSSPNSTSTWSAS